MTPLLFMGQEWAACTPFLFFTDHDAELGEAVSRGRREEFKHFAAFSDPELRATIPDPQALDTFERSRLRWDERREPEHARVLDLYRELLSLRKTDEVLRQASSASCVQRLSRVSCASRALLAAKSACCWSTSARCRCRSSRSSCRRTSALCSAAVPSSQGDSGAAAHGGHPGDTVRRRQWVSGNFDRVGGTWRTTTR